MRILPIFHNNINLVSTKKKQKESVNEGSIRFSKNYAESIKNQSLSFVSFSGKSNPVYKIDKDLNCTYYDKQSKLITELGVSPQSISACLAGRRSNLDGIVIVRPEEVITRLVDGTSIVDKKKVAEVYNKRLNPNSVYVLDYNGNYTYFHTRSKIDSTKGFVIVDASTVESFDDNGKKVIDRKKLSEALIQHPQYSAVYAFDRQSNFVKYKNQADYAEKNGVSKTAVSSAVQKQNRTVNGEYVIPAKEIEKVSEDGVISIDRHKLAIYFDRKYKPSETRRYTVSENMQLTRYETSKELAAATGMNYATLIYSSNRLTPMGEYIIPANEIEEIGEDGQFFVNDAKLQRAVWERNVEDAVYTIDINYNLTRHKDKKAVAEALNRADSTISSVLYEDGVHQTVADNVLVKASEIESMDEDGNIVIDKKKVIELVQKKLCPRAVYLVSKDGQCKKFKNRFAIAKDIGGHHGKADIRVNGFVVVDAKLLEEINEDGSISLNPERVAFYSSRSKNTF